MTPDEIRRLRSDLHCTARELAATLGIDASAVNAWEAGERFPTKKHVAALNELRVLGPSAIVRLTKKRATHPTNRLDLLSDATFWLLVRKLVAYPELLEQAQALAAALPDPVATEVEHKG